MERLCTVGVQGFLSRSVDRKPVIPVGSAKAPEEALLASPGIVGHLDLVPAEDDPLLAHSGDQLLDPEDVDDSFEIVDKNGEAHFSSHFFQSASQKISLVHPSLDRTKGMFNNTFPSFHLLRVCQDSLLHVFHQTFMHPSRDSPIPFITRALSFERTSLASGGGIIADLPSLFNRPESKR
jgi:hypothetical protein